MKCKMKLEKETRFAVRYQELNNHGEVKGIADGAILGTMYIRKSAFDGSYPISIEVSIEGK